MLQTMRKQALFVLLLMGAASAQTLSLGNMFHRPSTPAQVGGPSRLDEFVVNGKLRLTLTDAIQLTLLNNSDINTDRAQYDIARYGVRRAMQPFDPVAIARFQPSRSASPSATSLNGASTLSTLSQNTNFGISQEFQTGTTLGVTLDTTRFTTNSTFATVNPSYTSGLNFSLTQPLLRNFGMFATRAPIIIAQRSTDQSRASFAAQVNDTVSRVVNQYWDVVQARKTLEVLRKSQDLAQASYDRDKHALELGALPPLDIYRSESQVAERKIAVIQAEYQLKQNEDAFRQSIGADLDERAGALDLDLTESVEATAPLAVVDYQQILTTAIHNRPEIDAQTQQMAINDANIRVATNNLKPDLSLNATYSSNGLGGVVLGKDASGLPVVVSNGGFGDSISQLGGFNFPTYGFSLQMRFPIHNSAAAADLGTALVTKKRSLYQMRGLQESITTQVKNAVHDLELSELVMAASQTSRDLASKNLEAEERKYQLGAETIFFVLDAQNQLSQAELSLVQAQIAYKRALTEVDHATGALLDKYKVTLEAPAP